MRSYGRVDSSWDGAKIRSVLEDALRMSEKHDISVCIGEDVDGNVVALSDPRDTHVFVCGVAKKDSRRAGLERELEGEFWDNVGWARYTVDEMIPRMHDFLANGIIKYGHLRFISEGRLQLTGALKDARKMVKKRGRPFILGLSKKHGIMTAPMSEKSEFFAPLSCVITKSNCWSVSDMHSDVIPEPRDLRGGESPMRVLYNGIAYGVKQYGWYESSQDRCISNLERAFEDAVNMPRCENPNCVGRRGRKIIMQPKEKQMLKRNDYGFLEVDPREFLDGSMLLREKITAAAKDAYGQLGGA